MQPLQNKGGANSASLEISKACEIVLKYVEAHMLWLLQMSTEGISSVLLLESGIVFFFFFFFSVCFGFASLFCILFFH